MFNNLPTYLFLNLAFLISLAMVPSSAMSQNTDLQMAQYYYGNGDFEKAKLYYEKIVKTNSSATIYTEYLNTLIELEEYSEAEKITKKQIKKERFGAFYKVTLGTIYEKQGKEKKATEYYDDLIHSFNKKNSPSEYNLLTNEFVRLLKYELAIKTMERCEKMHPNSNYSISIANLYGMKGDYEKMIDSYLRQIEKKPRDLNRVKMFLPRSINFEEDENTVELLRVKLLKKVQRNPENESFYDLLIWMFQQKGDFESAFIQVKAFDKRTKAKGEKVYKFARLCVSNKEYEIAIEAYEYVINSQNDINYFALSSKQEILTALQRKIFSSSNYTNSDLLNLKQRYIETLKGINHLSEKVPLIEGLAHIEGFYIHNVDTAEALYRQLLTYPGINKKRKALNKIRLADILMLKNQIWDASLLYMQVEKEFKHDLIGSTAKFKNAKLYYYSGDFEWSQNQLDGLKASTSKLISNDAIELSLLITDNYNMDTTVVNMKQFSEADLLIFQHKYGEATKKLDSIIQRNPEHSLADEILYKRYEIAFKRQEFEESKKFLKKIIDDYPDDILADNALFKLAELEENQLKNTKAAFALYEKLLFNYPGSLYVVEARKRYRKYAEKFSKQEKFSKGIKIEN